VWPEKAADWRATASLETAVATIWFGNPDELSAAIFLRHGVMHRLMMSLTKRNEPMCNGVCVGILQAGGLVVLSIAGVLLLLAVLTGVFGLVGAIFQLVLGLLTALGQINNAFIDFSIKVFRLSRLEENLATRRSTALKAVLTITVAMFFVAPAYALLVADPLAGHPLTMSSLVLVGFFNVLGGVLMLAILAKQDQHRTIGLGGFIGTFFAGGYIANLLAH
jgi:hypothetical protein